MRLRILNRDLSLEGPIGALGSLLSMPILLLAAMLNLLLLLATAICLIPAFLLLVTFGKTRAAHNLDIVSFECYPFLRYFSKKKLDN